AVLEQEYYEVRPVSLLGDEVPVETAVLVIAGPRKSFLPEELAVLDRYLQRPGQALIMLDPLRAPVLAAHLHKYDVSLPPDAEFASNFFIEYLGNKDLFVNTINWLARDPQAISHRPRRQELGIAQFYVSNEQATRSSGAPRSSSPPSSPPSGSRWRPGGGADS